MSNVNSITAENKILKSFQSKKINIHLNLDNITEKEISNIIKLVFDKISYIFDKYNWDTKNILHHIGSPFYILWIWQMFNFYLQENKLPLLPQISVNTPFIKPRYWCRLNPFNNTLDLKCTGKHFPAIYFTLYKKENEEFKKFIEEWINKYYILEKKPDFTVFEIYDHII